MSPSVSLPRWLHFTAATWGLGQGFWVSHMSPGAQGAWPCSTSFPGELAGGWMGSGAAATEIDSCYGMSALQVAA